MSTPKFRTPEYLRVKYQEIAEDPNSTIDQKLRALNKLESIMKKFKKRTGWKKHFERINARKQKASQPVEVSKPDGVVNEKLLGSISE
jgi:biotin-(acetyl-CoA carboxylase) ligase